jgi:hypothetical protein
MIPFIGPFLAPVAVAIGLLAGHRVDKKYAGEDLQYGKMAIAEDVVTMAKEFFRLLAAVFFGLKEYFES